MDKKYKSAEKSEHLYYSQECRGQIIQSLYYYLKNKIKKSESRCRLRARKQNKNENKKKIWNMDMRINNL
jgi:hypothetical protein